TLAMARLYRGNVMSPNSASTQFYICLGDAPHLDSMGFTAFGSVIEGLDVIDRIAVGDKILQARVLPQTEGDAT
ncbi:MAG: peptidylprolyl isomerase, partial [Proteobacteria bacterium]|nr:peptidylprolyl isomerase [Pseudomonadota bacterium]